MPTHNTLLALLSALAAACAAPVVHVAPRVSHLSGPRAPAGRLRTNTLIAPPIGSPRLLAREPGAAAYYAVGGIRVRLRAGNAVAAEQPFASTLVGAARTSDGGWLMVSASGTIARAQDWVGSMRFVRTLGAPVVRAFASQGSLVAVFADGRALRLDPVARADVLMPASLLASPEAVPLDVPEEQAAVVAQAALTAFPYARIALTSTAVLGSGALALRGGEYLQFVAPARDGGFAARARVALLGEPAGDCALLGWGARALLACGAPGDGSGAVPPADVFSVDEDGSVTEVSHARRGALIAGREGHTLTYAGPCAAGQPAVEGATVACTLDRDRPFREWQFPESGARLLDVYDGRALLAVTRGETTGLVLYEIDTAHQRPIELSDPTAELDRAGFAPDGRVLVLARVGSHARFSRVGIARVGEPMALHSLGFLAADVAMADARHGLAVGADASEVARTTDGGANWGRPEVAIDGDLTGAPLLVAPREVTGVGRAGALVECGPSVCRAGRLVHYVTGALERVPAME